MMSKKNILIFFLILIIASFLRLYRITNIPPGVNRDEASIGYTAYSILHTGRDEYGRLFPLSFQSFGDWKLPLYIYTVIPFVSIFGLSELAVRLPSAVFGILSVFLTFYLIKIFFKNNLLAFISMFLVAISPWSIHLSRVESESNTAVFLMLLGMTLFFRSLNSKNWLIIPSFICFALTYFTYAGNHIFTTLLIVGLLIIYKGQITKSKSSFVAFAVFIFLSGFIFYSTLFGADKTKLAGISVFGDPSIVHAKIEIPRNEHNNPKSFFTKIIHNKLIYAGEKIFQNYINSFSPSFLFIKGGENNAHNIANFGNMYLIEAPFLFLGLVCFIFTKKSKEKKLILLWFFIAPIASSITKDAPHTNRMFAIFPVLELMVAFGIFWIISEWFKKSFFKRIFIGCLILLFTFNIAIYVDRYYIHFPRNEEKNWGIGYKKLNKILSQESFTNKKILMSRPEYSPYIYLLFYNSYDPAHYQKEALRYPPTEDGFIDVKEFDKYKFRKIDWGKDVQLSSSLIVDWSDQVPVSIKNLFHTKEVILSNGQSMFTVVETR